jgi:hypothetical protein
MAVVNESGLYALLFYMQPQKSTAQNEFTLARINQLKAFRKWVTHEVLPALRKTGEYATPAKQKEKAQKHDELAAKRLDIMEKNANWRSGKLLFDMVNKYADMLTPDSKVMYLANAAELTSGMNTTNMLPTVAKKEYTATEIGEICGVSSAKIGKIANQHNIKAPQGESNEYGRWALSKSPHSPKEVMTWVYYEKAVDWFKEFFKIEKTA